MVVSPYVMFHGNAKEAMDFYVSAFGGKIEQCKTFKDAPKLPEGGSKDISNKIMHAEVSFHGTKILLCDDVKRPAKATVENGVHVSVECADLETTKTSFNKLSAGGKVQLPLAKQFWGDTFGSVTDKFGVNWMFNCSDKK
jgi:PhnB protein